MNKYARLRDHMRKLETDSWEVTFSEIEAIMGCELPKSARSYQAWWANHSHRGRHSRAWLNIGWEKESVDIEGETVWFRRRRKPATSIRRRRKAT